MPLAANGHPRRYDIALLGATGTYGALSARQLLLWAPPGARIALAGRDLDKLRGLRASLTQRSTPRDLDSCRRDGGGGSGSERPGPEVSVYEQAVDMYDEEALRALAASTAVLASAVRADGAAASDAVIAACVAEGAHYTDLQPKPGALCHIAERFDSAARAARVLLAPGCGFDYAVPDVAVAITERRCEDVLGASPRWVRKVFAVRPGQQGPAFRRAARAAQGHRGTSPRAPTA
ncbi:hypothetical protein PLESTB_001242800 [Pleodorina starrii]|uniref:Saccharopine dehydrogenase NADP binding domain-containing protein n=1 Tax=Pleodorina starrii TaxID=330485 RepID=A0A9W6BSD0_9CHLO|nr:hypothetical protein PLESTM_000216900 [Pleodorina starrii]GLC57581.1 hypothetical protein PLESTB_001242800 [Pleodorina starrii]